MKAKQKIIFGLIATALSMPAFAWDGSIEAKSAIQMGELMRGQRHVLHNILYIHSKTVCQEKRGGRGSYRWDTIELDGVIRAASTGSPDSYKFTGSTGVFGDRDYNAGKKWTTKGASWIGESCVIKTVTGAGKNSWKYGDDFEVWAVPGGIEMSGSMMGTSFTDGYSQGDKGFVPLTMTWEEAHEFVNKFLDVKEKGEF